jgi:hypothetical protein
LGEKWLEVFIYLFIYLYFIRRIHRRSDVQVPRDPRPAQRAMAVNKIQQILTTKIKEIPRLLVLAMLSASSSVVVFYLSVLFVIGPGKGSIRPYRKRGRHHENKTQRKSP